MPTTLPELCEPLFQYMCRLNRMGRKNAPLVAPAVRAEIKALFEEMRQTAARTSGLAPKFQAVELPLIFFVDSMIADGNLSISAEWNKDRLAYERNELAGDEKFFDLLDATLADKSGEASERLVIYYTCVGLGFTGWYATQPEFLRKKMIEIAPRLKERMETDATARLCADAYAHVNTTNLPLPVGTRVLGMALVFAGLLALTLFANFYLFRLSSHDLSSAIDEVNRHDPVTAAKAP
jgi:type VI protein secretion system component VasF